MIQTRATSRALLPGILLPALALLLGAWLTFGLPGESAIDSEPGTGALAPRASGAVPVRPPGVSRLAQRLLAEGPVEGIALGLFSQDPRYDYVKLLEEIRDTGSPWVSLVCNYYQPTADSEQVGVPDPRSPGWPRLVLTIRNARALGLKVLLFPILLLQDQGEDDWRGTIAPGDRARWYANYTRLLVRLARIAEQEGVEMLSVGSEFNSMQVDADRWRQLVTTVRGTYSGALTYSVNWDTIGEPRFLDALDFVGMTSYFSLTSKNDPTVTEIVNAWAPYHEEIVMWQIHHGQPLIFTEVGFASQDGANQNPWNYLLTEDVDLAEQRDCYEAFLRVWRDEPALSGPFFYNWFGKGGPEDRGYSPRGKPAAKLIRQWFQRPETRTTEEPDG